MTFRRAVYMRGSYPGQIDHPGWLSKVVEDSAALEAAVAEGWRTEMVDDPAPAAPALTIDPLADPVSDAVADVAPKRGRRKASD